MWIEAENGTLVNLGSIKTIGIREMEEHVSRKIVVQLWACFSDNSVLLCTGKEKAEQYKDIIAEKLHAFAITQKLKGGDFHVQNDFIQHKRLRKMDQREAPRAEGQDGLEPEFPDKEVPGVHVGQGIEGSEHPA